MVLQHCAWILVRVKLSKQILQLQKTHDIAEYKKYPRSIMHGRKRPFSIVFDPFHINRITAVFCRLLSECKWSDTAFSHRIRLFSTVYDTVKYGRNTVHMKRVKYGPFTVINDSIRGGFQRIRSPLSVSWDCEETDVEGLCNRKFFDTLVGLKLTRQRIVAGLVDFVVEGIEA